MFFQDYCLQTHLQAHKQAPRIIIRRKEILSIHHFFPSEPHDKARVRHFRKLSIILLQQNSGVSIHQDLSLSYT